MQSATRQAQVQLAQDTVADAHLGLQGVAESVTVTAEASLIDKDSATHQERARRPIRSARCLSVRSTAI